MSIKTILKYIISWRIALILIAAIGISLLPFSDSFPYRESVLEPFGHPLLYSWANFDGVHYLGIARQGYFAQFTQAFFPLFPYAVRWANPFSQNHLLTGLIISHTSLILALYFLYKLIRLDHSKKISKRVVFLLLLFPTSFFFGSLYTESLFLLFIVTSFYFMRTRRPLIAITLAALASATRIIGVFMLPALLLEKHDQLPKPQRKHMKHYLPFAFSISGLLGYMYYLHTNFSDALYFLNAQPAFGASRSADKLILLYQVIYRYTRMVLTVEPQSFLFYSVSQEFLLSIIFLILSVWAFWRVRRSYALFGFLAFMAPTLTGTFSSMPRYVLILFPALIVLAQTKNKLLFRLWLTVSVILLVINTILFTRGYWVA